MAKPEPQSCSASAFPYFEADTEIGVVLVYFLVQYNLPNVGEGQGEVVPGGSRLIWKFSPKSSFLVASSKTVMEKWQIYLCYFSQLVLIF